MAIHRRDLLPTPKVNNLLNAPIDYGLPVHIFSPQKLKCQHPKPFWVFLMNFNEMHILALKVTWSIDFDECCCVTKYTSNSKAWVDQLVPSPALLSSKVAVSTREKLQSDNAAHFFVFTPSTARSRCCPPQIPWKSADDSL